MRIAQEAEIFKILLPPVSKLQAATFQTRSGNLAVITPNSTNAYVAGEPREALEREEAGLTLGNLNFYGHFRPALKK